MSWERDEIYHENEAKRVEEETKSGSGPLFPLLFQEALEENEMSIRNKENNAEKLNVNKKK